VEDDRADAFDVRLRAQHRGTQRFVEFQRAGG
jgi:hypothetical protein